MSEQERQTATTPADERIAALPERPQENALDRALAELLRRMDSLRATDRIAAGSDLGADSHRDEDSPAGASKETESPENETNEDESPAEQPQDDFPYNLFRLASALTREGHVCLDLAAPEHRSLLGERSLAKVRRELLNHAGVGQPGQKKPLLLSENRLYLYRYFRHEKDVVEEIIRRSRSTAGANAPAAPDDLMRPANGAAEEDAEQAAVAQAMRERGLLIVTGGPGTGKTTTIVRALARLLRESPGLRLALTAPTGKAALRLRESVEKACERLDLTAEEAAALLGNVGTLHRLLGTRPGTAETYHNQDRPLTLDLLLIDEASMIDLPLLARTLNALPPEAKLVLAGDHHQLASVEAGSVLGDIFSAARELRDNSSDDHLSLFARERHALIDCIRELTRNYRFGGESEIAALSRSINAGRAAEALRLLKRPGGAGIRLGGDVSRLLAGRERYFPEKHPELARLRERILTGYGAYVREGDPLAALAAFENFRILCALREGPAGVSTLNRLCEDVLLEAGLLKLGAAAHYPGRPIIILRNDYGAGLFNGDTGLILERDGRLQACFRDPAGGVRFIAADHLPEHKTAFAMTVHKSQGSEFREVLLVLPASQSPVLTRELIYTALTRAVAEFEVFAAEETLSFAIKRRTRRASGLRQELLRYGADLG